MKNDEMKYIVSEEAMLVSTLNHLTAIALGNDEEKEIGRLQLSKVGRVLLQDNDTDRAMYVGIAAKLVGDMELEAVALTILRDDGLTEEQYATYSKFDWSHVEFDESQLKKMSPVLINGLLNCGVENIEVSFAELDGLAKEIGA